MAASEPPIPKHGGYRKLKSFQVAQLSQKGQLGEVETRVHMEFLLIAELNPFLREKGVLGRQLLGSSGN
jgi:hypothetical protein